MWNARSHEAQAGIKIAGRNINNLRYEDDTLMAGSEEELKSLLMKVKEESEWVGLNFSIQKTKIMASGPITSWLKVGKKCRNSHRLYFLGLQNHMMMTAAMKFKDAWFLEGLKPMTNLDSPLKTRDITLPTKVRLVKAMVFQVVMYGCESWTIKKAEHQRIDAFKLWCWRGLLRIPWTARRSN